jgi:hypothetical protein
MNDLPLGNKAQIADELRRRAKAARGRYGRSWRLSRKRLLLVRHGYSEHGRRHLIADAR